MPNSNLPRWKVRITCVALSACLLISTPVAAWGPDGHRLVGAIADHLLQGTKAASRVKQLLGDKSLAQVAAWADCAKHIRPEQDFVYTDAGRFPECLPFETPTGIAAMADFVRRNDRQCAGSPSQESCHKRYHYADLNVTDAHYRADATGASEVDVVHTLRALIAKLQGKPVPAPFHFGSDVEALMLLVHIVGDLHQPLHMGSVYLDEAGNVVNPESSKYGSAMHTAGGNDLQSGRSNLHQMWDAVPVSWKNAEFENHLYQSANLRWNVKSGLVPELAPQSWADESLLHAKTAFMDLRYGRREMMERGERWPVELPANYAATMDQVKQQAITDAGVRLAKLLVAIYGA